MAVVRFDGDYLDTIFVADHDTKAFQFGLEIVNRNAALPNNDVYDMVVAVIDTKNKRKEYVLTCTALQLKVLKDLIESVLKQTANNT